MRLKKKAVIPFLLTALLLALLCGCGEGKEPEQTQLPEQTQAIDPAPVPEETPETAEPAQEVEPERTEEPEEPEEPETPDEPEDPELTDPNRDWEPIDTKFGRLRYPDQFFDYLETEQTETETEIKVLFRAVIGEKRIDLFEVTIGDEAEDQVGTLTGPDGVVRGVFLRFIEIEDLNGLSEGETNRVYAMQESLNYIIDNLR